MKKNVLAQVPMKTKKWMVAVLALLLMVGLVPAGANLLTKAVTADNYTTTMPNEVFLGNYNSIGDGRTAPSSITQGQWVTYTYNNKAYAYQAKFNIAEGETLVLRGDGSILELDRGGALPNAIKANDLVTGSLENGVYTLKLNDEATLKAGETYYYDLGDGEYYLFTPEQTLGGDDTKTDRTRYTASANYNNNYVGKLDQKGENIAVVIDTNAHTLNYTGNQYTKHYVYQRVNSLEDGKIYLIGSRSTKGSVADVNLISRGGLHSTYHSDDGSESTCKNKNEWTYAGTVTSVAGAEHISTDNSMVLNIGNTTGIGAYIDAGIVDAETVNTADTYVFSELLTAPASTADALQFGFSVDFQNLTGFKLMGTTDDGQSYTDKLAFGSQYTWDAATQKTLSFLPYCDAKTYIGLSLVNGQLSHNNGTVWAYDTANQRMYNNNAFAGVRFLPPGINDGARYLVVTKSEAYAVTSENSASKVYPYELKVAYKKASAALSENLTVYSQNTGINTLQAIPMEKVSAELTYKGVKENKTFDIVYRLVDENGNGVNGQYGNVNFENGNGSKTELKNGDTFNLGWIPHGYKLTTRSVVSSDSSDPDKKYQVTATENGNDWAVNTAITIGAKEELKYVIDDPLREVTIKLTHDGIGTHSDDEFDVTISLIERDGNPSNKSHEDINGTKIQFQNGEYTTTFLNGDELTLKIPNGSQISVASEYYDRIQYAVLYYGNQVLGTTNDGSDKDVKLPTTPKAVTEAIDKYHRYGERAYIASPNEAQKYAKIQSDETVLVNLPFKKLTTTVIQTIDYTGIKLNELYFFDTVTNVKLYLEDSSNPNMKVPIEYSGKRRNSALDSDISTTSINVKKSDNKTDTGSDFGIKWDTIYVYNKTDNNRRQGANGSSNKVANAAVITVTGIPVGYRLFADLNCSITTENNNGNASGEFGSLLGTLNSYPVAYNTDPDKNSSKKSINQSRIEIDPTRETNNIVFSAYTGKGTFVSTPIYNVLLHGNPNTKIKYYVGSLVYRKNTTGNGYTTSAVGDPGYDKFTEKKIPESPEKESELYVDKDKIYQNTTTKKIWQGRIDATLSETKLLALPNYSATGYSGIFARLKVKEDLASNDVTKKYVFYDSKNNLVNDLEQKGYYVTNVEHKKLYTFNNHAYADLPNSNGTENFIKITYDIIPQYVNIKLDASQQNGNYVNRNKRFPVKLVLLDDNGRVVRDQSYVLCDENKNSLTSTSFAAASDDMELKNGSVELNFNGNDGAILNMKTGENFWLRLPYGYTVIASEPEEAIGPYTPSYETKWEDKADGQWNDVATLAKDDTTNRVTIGKDLQFNTVDVNVAGVDKKQYQIVITNTRNDVEDDLGLFGGKANRAFLAFVGILSVTAAGAYIYTKKEKQEE